MSGCGEMEDAAGMIGVEVREDDVADVANVEAERVSECVSAAGRRQAGGYAVPACKSWVTPLRSVASPSEEAWVSAFS